MTHRFPPLLQCALLSALLGLQLPAAAQAARVLTLAGTATLERNGQTQPLASDSHVESGDLISVGERSALQLRFTDESIVALRAMTQLKVEAYRYDRNAGADRSVLGLLRGGMRTITGFIARDSRRNYEVRTTIATLGVRGTHYTLVTCDGDCTNPDGSQAPNGVFGGVTDGRIAVTNQSGEQEFGQQEYFQVVSATAPPVRLLAPPAVLSDRGLVTRARAPGLQAAAGETRSERRAAADQSTSPQPTTPGRSPAALQQVLRAANAANDKPALVALISGGSSEITTVLARGIANTQVSSVEVLSDNRSVREIKAELPDVRDELIFNSATLAAALSKTRNVERLAAAGVYWSYQPPQSGSPGSLGTHYTWGDRPSVAPPTAGVAQYAFGGGTTPVDNFGRTGELTAGRLSMDFSARQVKALDPIGMSFARTGTALNATSYTLPAGSQWSMSDGAQRLTGVTCSGCLGGAQGTINGRFVGATAQGYAAGLAFQTRIPAPGTSTLNHAGAAAAAFGR